MKKVIPKKKDAFLIIPIDPVEMDSSDFSSFQSAFFQSSSLESPSISPSSSSTVGVEESLGVAGKNIFVGDVVMLDKNGMIVPFLASEGKSDEKEKIL